MNKFFYITALLLAVCSCRKDALPDNNGEHRLALRFKSGLYGEQPQTKSTYTLLHTGDNEGLFLGIFVCDHHEGHDANPYTPFGNGMNNIQTKAVLKDGVQKWSFYLKGINSWFSDLVITEKKVDGQNVTADIFAYFPYNSNITTPEKIPFKVGLDLNSIPQESFSIARKMYRDLLYAEENIPTNTANKNIDPNAKDPFSGNYLQEAEVGLHMRHALARIEFNVKLNNESVNNPGGDKTNDKFAFQVLLKRRSGYLYSGGNFNSIDCTFDSLELCDSMYVASQAIGRGSGHYSVSQSHTGATIVPTQEGEEYQDDDYEFFFNVDGVDLSQTFLLKREQIRHGDSAVYGFKPGYKYTFNFTYDNFIRFDSIEIGEWTVQEDPLYEIDI